MKIIDLAITILFCGILTKVQAQNLTQSESVSIFENLTKVKPIYCESVGSGNNQFIICLADKRGTQKEIISDPDIICYKLSQYANTWQIDSQEPLFKESFKYCEFLNSFELTNINNEPYLFFNYTISDQGSAAGDIETLKFALVSLNDYHFTTLDFEGDAVYDKSDKFQYIKNGTFLNLQEIKANSNLSKFFEEEVSKTLYIYHPTTKDLDINDPINFEKKWAIDNPQVVEKVYQTGKPNLYNEPLNITYYNGSLFPTDKSYISEEAENLKYKFITSFRGSILGFDKQNKKYFALWVDICNAGCDKDISLSNSNTLKIVYKESNDQTVLVNLSKMTYSLSYKKTPDQSSALQTSYPVLKVDYFKTLGQPIFLYKSDSFIKTVLAKDKAWHLDGYMQNDFSMNVLTYSHNYKPKNSVGFQAKYYYWISGDQNLCLHFFVEFPATYLKYMLTKFNGFVVIDESHLLSKDREVGVSASINNGMCNMEFYKNN